MSNIIKLSEERINNIIHTIVTKKLQEMDYYTDKKYNSDYHDENTEEEGDSYLYSFQYVLETYVNGQFGQLRDQLKDIIRSKQNGELIDYLESDGSESASELIKWTVRNMDELI